MTTLSLLINWINVCLHCCCYSTDDRNLIIYVSVAAAAAVAIATIVAVTFYATWRASSAANVATRPLVSASPAIVSSRPVFVKPAVFSRSAPAYMCSRDYSGYYSNGYYSNERSAYRPHPHCFHSRINVYSGQLSPFWVSLLIFEHSFIKRTGRWWLQW